MKLLEREKRFGSTMWALKLSLVLLAAQVMLTKLARTLSLWLTSLVLWKKVQAAQTKPLTTIGAR